MSHFGSLIYYYPLFGVPVIQNPALRCKDGTRKADYDAQLAAYKTAHPEDPFGAFFVFKPAVCYSDPPTQPTGPEYECVGPPGDRDCYESQAWIDY